MMAWEQKYDFNGHRYVLEGDCFGAIPYYIKPDGGRTELPVHGPYMTAEAAIKIHAMNMSGYCP